MKSKLLLLIFALSFVSCTKTIEVEKEVIVEVPIEEKFEGFKIEKFGFPLPKEYMQNISSIQGLRNGNETYSTNYHNAIDFAVPIRTKVFASKSGIIENVYPSYDNGEKWKGHEIFGGLIEIRHFDGTRTLYAHLIRTDVKEGQYVEKGQLIGASGGKRNMRGSGVSTGPHLHFSIYVDIESMFED